VTETLFPLGRSATIAVLGGTGAQGMGLATRLSQLEFRVLIGSRSAKRASAVAASLGPLVQGADNSDAALDCDLALVAVPYNGHAAMLADLKEQLAGKIVIDCVSPLGFDERGPFALPVPSGSACEEAQQILSESRVVGAFHHLSADLLSDRAVKRLAGDVLVLGDDREATETVQDLVGLIADLRGIYAGRLRNAGQVESLTANLISINRRYKTQAGIAVTGLTDQGSVLLGRGP